MPHAFLVGGRFLAILAGPTVTVILIVAEPGGLTAAVRTRHATARGP